MKGLIKLMDIVCLMALFFAVVTVWTIEVPKPDLYSKLASGTLEVGDSGTLSARDLRALINTIKNN